MLHNPQFMSRDSKHIAPELMTSSVFGRKDITYNYTDICESIFSQSQKKRAIDRLIKQHMNNSTSFQFTQFDFLAESLMVYDELDFVLSGIFENYLSVRYIDLLKVSLSSFFFYFINKFLKTG